MHSGWDSALPPVVSLGTAAEAQEGLGRMRLVPCGVCILALLQPLRLLLTLPGIWGWQWADLPHCFSLSTSDSRGP